jgi:hypothetical protein
MKGQYQFSVLRYVYDPVTLEFVNVGVALYAPQHGFIGAMCTNHYSRVSTMFGRIDGQLFRSTTRYIESRVSALNQEIAKGLLFQREEDRLEIILDRILPPDDSALKFTSGGVGITEHPEKTLSNIFARYVSRYESKPETSRRDDEDVWKVFRDPLEKKSIVSRLSPKKIVAANYEYEFQRSWKNGIWHVYEPVSLDLVDGNSILDKANRWLGRATSLRDSPEAFKLFLLLGQPSDYKLRETYRKAKNILSRMPGETELIQESDAEEFAEELQAEFQAHFAEESR